MRPPFPSPGGSNHWLLASTAAGPDGYHIDNEKYGPGGLAGLPAAHGRPHPAGEHVGQGQELPLAGGLLPGPELHVQTHNLCRHGAVSIFFFGFINNRATKEKEVRRSSGGPPSSSTFSIQGVRQTTSVVKRMPTATKTAMRTAVCVLSMGV